MIRSIKPIVCAVLLFSFSSCGDDAAEKEAVAGSGLVTFTAVTGDAETRNTQESSFETGDAIGVFAIEPKTGVYWAVNNEYIYDGNTFKPATEADNIIVTVGTDFDFYIYYPFKEGQTDITAISHSAGDQAEKSGWLSADFMTATYTEPVLNYTIPLNFRHRLSTVEVRIERNEGVREAAIENVKRTSRFNLLTGEVVTDESRGNCRMYRYSQQGDATTVFRVTVPAQTLTTSSNYVALTGDTDIKLRGTSDMVTLAGQIHNYSIDYKKQITVLDYTAGGTTTGAGLYNIGSTCTVRASVNGGYEFAGWYEAGRIVSDAVQYSFEVLTDRTLEPKYRNYGGWSVTLTANPSSLGWKGGNSTLTAGASRDVFVNGIKESSQTGSPSITGGSDGFFLSGNTVTVAENNTASARSCVFTASYGGNSATATISQEAAPVSYYFSYTDGSTTHSERTEASAGSFTLSITSYKVTGNSRRDLSWSVSGDSWIHVSGSSVSYDENPGKEIRSGNVTLTQAESGKTITLTVRQKGKTSVDIDP
ncbi:MULTISPECIES: fimbrillin family protein [Bacteroidales]|jgi:lipopolysaccharide export system protein LptA|uniref:Fimbrillin family protein n=1 Tax=Bacteroides eggerthii TaxID=28111 RepID=A0A4Q5GY62_9BACE|nr:fimbrillin family protein [Bacteroides eggerthii]KAA5273866.1 fimbrillin family protein [Bacteroides eggerthii]KAA5286353.1 fimbrillin family protein [Bacteroides eggerthii]RYT73787.1 fimbrillin family protein [Bacteroides eggerthii]